MTTGGTARPGRPGFTTTIPTRAICGSRVALALALPGRKRCTPRNLDITANGETPRWTSIDPAQLPMGMVGASCVAVWPHNSLQTNTIFNVAHNAQLYTAWSDKHPSYEILTGPSGDGVDDLYTPEINASAVPEPTTVSVTKTTEYDQLKVAAILNEIDGKSADGSRSAGVPAIFGMNFQSVSVAEKLVNPTLSRYERKALILTSNRALAEWPDAFANNLLASAALDRLTHHCHVLVIRAESYRQPGRRKEDRAPDLPPAKLPELDSWPTPR